MRKLSQLTGILEKLDLTEIFKGKGDAKRWSAKRTIGGAIVTFALLHMEQVGDITNQGILLCLVGVLPLCLSFLEKD